MVEGAADIHPAVVGYADALFSCGPVGEKEEEREGGMIVCFEQDYMKCDAFHGSPIRVYNTLHSISTSEDRDEKRTKYGDIAGREGGREVGRKGKPTWFD